jgi:LPXTG-motif cell wall-anchored protein
MKKRTQDHILVHKLHQIQKGNGEKMKSHKLQIVMFCLVALATLFVSGNAQADTWNKLTKLTFAEPVEVSGTVLQPGTYWFSLLDSSSDRHVVQIWNGDRSQLITTVLAIPNYRLRPTGNTVVKFSERPTGTPEAIRAWFYPGDNFGQEFVYPKTRATQIAGNVAEPVLSVRDEPATAPEPVLEQAPVKAVEPSGDEVEVAAVVETVAALPETGSPLPWLGLLGLLAVGAGLALRYLPTGEAA